MTYFIVQMRDGDNWVLVPERWMSPSHRFFFRPASDNWERVAELAEGLDEMDEQNWKLCYIHGDITTADNVYDGLQKRNQKRIGNVDADAAVIDMMNIGYLLPPEVRPELPPLTQEGEERLRVLLRSIDGIGFPLRQANHLEKLDETLRGDAEFLRSFENILAPVRGRNPAEKVYARLNAVIPRDLAAAINPIETTNIETRKIGILQELRKFSDVYTKLYFQDLGFPLRPVQMDKYFKIEIKDWHKHLTGIGLPVRAGPHWQGSYIH